MTQESMGHSGVPGVRVTRTRKYLAGVGVAVGAQVAALFLARLLRHFLSLPLGTLEAWWRLPFTDQWISDLLADYVLPMVAVWLASRFLSGPLVSGSYAGWAWLGESAVRWAWRVLASWGSEGSYYLGLPPPPDPLNPPALVPERWLLILAFSVALGWLMRNRDPCKTEAATGGQAGTLP